MNKNLLLLFCLLACGIGLYVGCTKLNEYLDEEERWGAYHDLFPGKKGNHIRQIPKEIRFMDMALIYRTITQNRNGVS